jgi:hypothetical protein
MSPHGVILFGAVVLGLTGNLIFPRFAIWTVIATAIAVPSFLSLYLWVVPSWLGLTLVFIGSSVGAVFGVVAGTVGRRLLGGRIAE